MTDREFRRLSRKELVEIIYELQKSEAALKQQNEDLRAQLNDRRISLSKAGSIAEAALALSGIFEAAQDAADRYLDAVRVSVGQTESPQRQAMLDSELDTLLREAESLLSERGEDA